jgi:adenylate cyclase
LVFFLLHLFDHGDSIFAFFNSPLLPAEQHALLACDAGVSQLEMLDAMRLKWRQRGLPEFRIRIGIHTGNCLAGNVGTRHRMKYTLIGDVVNLASRLEGLGKFYSAELIVSSSTWSAPGVTEAFCGRALDIVKVVGKNECTSIVTILARRKRATVQQLEVERLSWIVLCLYQEQDFQNCLDTLAQMSVLLPTDDAVLKMMTARVERLMKASTMGLPLVEVNPVSQQWTGAHQMTEK